MKNSNTSMRRTYSGFTLLEMLLVLAISSSLILLMVNFASQKTDQLRRDKTVLQMQQIMNAAMSYYVNNSGWPVTCGDGSASYWKDPSTLSTDPNSAATTNFNSKYIFGLTANPYGQPYSVTCTNQTASTGGNFYVATSVNTMPADALIIAGSLPMAFINSSVAITQTDTTCATSPYTNCKTVVTSISIPGQNLNNARSINFAGLYYSGSCVPAPNCPTGMSASIIVMPAGVTGVGTTDTDAGCTSDPSNYSNPSNCTPYVYPLNSFSAFARGMDPYGTPGSAGTSGSSAGAPYSCESGPIPLSLSCVATDTSTTTAQAYTYMTSAPDSQTLYWRVCLSVSTEQGPVTLTSTSTTRWRQLGKMMGKIAAFTRCIPNSGNEIPSGSNSVFQPYQ